MRQSLLATALAFLASTHALAAGTAAPPVPSRPASAATAARNASVLQQLPFADREDYVSATRGLIAPYRSDTMSSDGQVVWSPQAYDFLRTDKSPDTVNPSLWRQAQLNAYAGLFQVTDRVYQIRGLDLANMTIVEGDTGLILIDTLATSETAKAALTLYYQSRPRKPVVAVIYTHSHLDHFGGVRGVVDEADVKAGKVAIYAPAGFLEEAVSENVFAGTAMLRRSYYQGATMVPRGERGQVDAGIGKGAPKHGTLGLIAPTVVLKEPVETRRIDGVDFEFQLTPGTEAPAEMNIWLPRFKALCMAENATPTMHNILTPRGALVRDAKAWGKYLDDSLVRYGNKAEVLFAQHNWPTWGGERIRNLLADQRDMYTWLNDRTLHLLNMGLTPAEIADDMRKLPGNLEKKWYTRGYYGSLSFNARAVYQRYLGFYDANPANLDPLTPVDAGRHYVAAMGGAANVLKLMRAAVDKGDYRWAVQLGNHLVFADPANAQARNLQADALEQLGYQSESSLWRNMYITGAQELRAGVHTASGNRATDLVRALEPSMFFDLLAVRLDSDKAQGHDMTLNWVFTDRKVPFALTLRNGVLTYREGRLHDKADATISMSKDTLDRINLRQVDLAAAVQKGDVRIEGDGRKLGELMGMLVTFRPDFNVVTP
ncbi:alkyl sulfatase [Cupriavidus necator]|uniref:alkyl/aryl-sulfatase n=1 Tax=Cupriavidus necator TaxID=106590 RepID=UPI0007356532|nr:alkyl sulfatase dimerization domain-containing protein [Cupriavidus necator]KUE84819.1 alkyl sulfatase [Cupriavidus necator]